MKKGKFIFLLARVCKQVIWDGSGYGIYIKFSFYTETSLIWELIDFYNFLFSL